MKGLITGIKRMEIHDGEGLRTTVFFKGCPLSCLWCHNPESISYEPQVAWLREKCISCGLCGGKRGVQEAADCPTAAQVFYGEEVCAKELVDRLARDRVFFERSGGGVTLSGGECLSQGEFCREVAEGLKERGIRVNVDTCGFVPRRSLERILPYVDCFLYDIKAIDPQLHRQCTGQTNEIILSNLEFLLAEGAAVEIRYPLVVGMNDVECEAIGKYLRDVPIRKIKVLQYHNFSASRYDALGIKCTLPPPRTTREHVKKAVERLRSFGLPAFGDEI